MYGGDIMALPKRYSNIESDTGAAFIADHLPMIVKLCRSTWQSHSATALCALEDVVQETLIVLWEKRQYIADREYAPALINRMTRNAAISFIRQQRRTAFPTIDLQVEYQ